MQRLQGLSAKPLAAQSTGSLCKPALLGLRCEIETYKKPGRTSRMPTQVSGGGTATILVTSGDSMEANIAQALWLQPRPGRSKLDLVAVSRTSSRNISRPCCYGLKTLLEEASRAQDILACRGLEMLASYCQDAGRRILQAPASNSLKRVRGHPSNTSVNSLTP